jgi:hypothetical protein
VNGVVERLRFIAQAGTTPVSQWDARYVVGLVADVLARAEDDARALWAMRVLDAYDLRVTGKQSRWEPFSGGTKTRGECCPNNGIRYPGNTREEARLAAARAVYLDLPGDVRAELGECP